MTPWLEVTRLFFRLGCTAFGGPLAHIAIMEREVVEERRWMDRSAFFDLLGCAQVLPGPTSTELAMLIGRARAGLLGLVVAGLAFILPSAVLVAGLAWLYVRTGQLPSAAGALMGLKAALIAVVIQALLTWGRSLFKGWKTWAVVGVSMGLAWRGSSPLQVLLIAGGLFVLLERAEIAKMAGVGAFSGPGIPLFSSGGLFFTFLKMGAVLYGSGYVLLAFLRAEFVVTRPWITEGQLLDAVAVGQFTPGPVFTTATFLGYLMRGGWGALMATIAIFLPAFLYTGLAGPAWSRLQRMAWARTLIDGVNLGALALMATVMVQLARASITTPVPFGIAALSGGVLWRTRWNPTWILLGAGVVGWAITGLPPAR